MKKNIKIWLNKKNQGYMLIILIVFAGIFVTLFCAATAYVLSQIQVANYKERQQKILEIAEAGINYYQWHLAHVPDDFTDGTGQPGPYIHDYKDIQNNLLGKFSLNIIPPAMGSTIVTIESTGYLISYPQSTRTVILKIGLPSFTTYAFLSNAEMYFGTGTEIWGPVHSNDGIRFDGIAHNLVTSAVDRYKDHTHPGPHQEFGVHTHVPPVDPVLDPDPHPIPNRPDVFMAGRVFPVPLVDFDSITADLSILKNDAIANGIYLASSGNQGYHIHFNPNHTVDITKVTSQKYCQYRYNQNAAWRDYNDIWSINQETSFTYNNQNSLGLPMPNNGIIFIEDDAWVDGKINNNRVTVATAREPLANAQGSIIINNNLTYTNYNGEDVIGLMANKDVAIGFYSDNNLKIDAAMVAKNGAVKRFYYPDLTNAYQNPENCAQNVYRNWITIFGTIATYQAYAFAYSDGTGYSIKNLNFDQNLTFNPPPGFPTTGEYHIISWEEK